MGWFAVLASALLFTACTDHSFAPRQGAPLDSQVLIGLTEVLPEHSLVLYCRTAREYPCVNYTLAAQAQTNRGGYSLQFDHVVAPAVCATAIGPARAELELGTLGDGEHTLAMRARGSRLAGTLHVSAGAYAVDAPGDAVSFPEPILRRLPANTLWGYFGYATPERRADADAVLAELRGLGATPATLAAGHYSVRLREHPGATLEGDAFTVDASGSPDYGASTGYYHVLPFALTHSGDLTAVRDLVARVGRTHGDAVHMRVFSTRGTAFYSWVLGR
ncbi:MAG: hypothetical protein ABL977_14700 [Candidatus Eisenbacteria bacterium]